MIRRLWLMAILIAPAVASGEMAVVATDRCDHGGTERYARALRDEVQHRPGLNVLSEAATIDRLGGAPRGSLADAERQISGSRIDFFQNHLARAERTLVAAIDDLLRLPPSAERWTGIREGLTLLAQVQLKAGRATDAKQTARRLLVVDRRYTPNTDTYPPSLREFFDRVRKDVQAEPNEELIVTTQPTGVIVHLNGRPLTKAPFKLTLPAGRYRLEGEFGPGRGIARMVDAGQMQSIELHEDFDGAISADRGPCVRTRGGREGRLVALVRLGSLLGVQQILAVREEEPTNGERYLVASVVDVATGEEAREARVKIYAGGFQPGALARLADFLATGEAEPPVQPLRGEITREPEVAVAPPTKPPDAPTKTDVEPAPVRPEPTATDAVPDARTARAEVSRVPSYVAFGTGGALLVGAGVLGLMASGTDRELDSLREGRAFRPGSEVRVTQLDGQLSTQRTAAASLGAAALGAAITGGVLWLMQGEDEEAAR